MSVNNVDFGDAWTMSPIYDLCIDNHSMPIKQYKAD